MNKERPKFVFKEVVRPRGVYCNKIVEHKGEREDIYYWYYKEVIREDIWDLAEFLMDYIDKKMKEKL